MDVEEKFKLAKILVLLLFNILNIYYECNACKFECKVESYCIYRLQILNKICKYVDELIYNKTKGNELIWCIYKEK